MKLHLMIAFLAILFSSGFTAKAQITSKEDSTSQTKDFLRKTERLKEFIDKGGVTLDERDAEVEEANRILTRGDKLPYDEIPTTITESLENEYEVPREKILYGYSLNDGIYEVHLERENQVVYFNRWDGKMFDVGLVFSNREDLRNVGVKERKRQHD